MCQCKSELIKDFIHGCPATVTVNALFAPNTDYIWEITDPFGNLYNLPFTTDADGFGEIVMSQLPDGFCNPHLPWFKIKVKNNLEECTYVDFVVLQNVECFHVDIKKGNTDKSWVGCKVTTPLSQPFDSGKVHILGEDGELSYQSDELINTKQMIVFNQTGVMDEGEDEDEYTMDDETGTINFNQSITDQKIVIIWFR